MGSTVFHPVGTCRMGSDANAVLDSELKVNGVKKFTCHRCICYAQNYFGKHNAPTYLIGEKGADMILNGNLRNARNFEEFIK